MDDKIIRRKFETARGDAPRTTQHAFTPAANARITGYGRAGIIIQQPMPGWAQGLADDLAQPPPAKEKKLGKLARQYNIRDGAAHITPEIFADLITKAPNFRTLLKYAPTIFIDNNAGLRLRFEACPPSDEAATITFSDVIKDGAFAALRGHESVLLSSGKRILGRLTLEETPQALVHHHSVAAGVTHTSQPEVAKGNFTNIFNSADSIKAAAAGAGTAITHKALFLGTLVQPDRAGLNTAELPAKSLLSVKKFLVDFRADPIADLFGQAAALLIRHNGDRDPLAVLLRPDGP